MDRKFWYSKKQQQFLKNIDTFYYSVFFDADFTHSSRSERVMALRSFCNNLKCELDGKDLTFGKEKYPVVYLPGCFSNYTIRFCKPEYFDVFVAPEVSTEETPHVIVQIRSRALWEEGVYKCFEESYHFVELLGKEFNLYVVDTRENRCDFACHSNYLQDPEKFFDRDHFVKMWMGQAGRTKEKTKHFLQHVTVYDDDATETDYIAIGKRGSKCFIRIYLKSKEVVQEGYKGFFLKMWFDEGMISQYDLYCLVAAYKQKSWAYLDIARLEWAIEYNDELDDEVKSKMKFAIDAEKIDINLVHKLAKKYTESVTKIFNIEFQCMRDMSKSFELISTHKGEKSRVLDYLDNYDLIYEYLTRVTLRLVRTDDKDTNKARRANCKFWDKLRSAKPMDFKNEHKDKKLIRKYTSNINVEIRKKRCISALSSFGYSLNQQKDGSIFDDASNFLSMLNDNDLKYIDKHKKKMASRNADVIPDEQKRHRSIAYYFFDPDTFND